MLRVGLKFFLMLPIDWIHSFCKSYPTWAHTISKIVCNWGTKRHIEYQMFFDMLGMFKPYPIRNMYNDDIFHINFDSYTMIVATFPWCCIIYYISLIISSMIFGTLCSINIQDVQFQAFDLGVFFEDAEAAFFDFAFALAVLFAFPFAAAGAFFDFSAFGAGVAKLSKIICAAVLAAAPLGNPPLFGRISSDDLAPVEMGPSEFPFLLVCFLARRVSVTSAFKLWTSASVNTLAWRFPSTLCVFRGNCPSWAREGAGTPAPEGVADGGVRFT